jgi:putative colanic acid biosynthesis acetyltransferase WcaF
MSVEFQDLAKFRVPPGFRGRSAPIVLLWQFVQATLFGLSPQPFYGWRRGLLRIFGAKIGRSVLVRSTARFTYPWKVEVGDFSWIGDHVEIYSLDKISVGRHAVVSQRSYLCAGSHDMNDVAFAYVTAPITVGDQAWIASDVFVAPGVTIGRGAVVGARSTVFDDIPPETVAFGEPARARRKRSGGETTRNG